MTGRLDCVGRNAKMTTAISIVLWLALAAALFYWVASTYMGVGVAAIRMFGYGETSGLPGVPLATGIVAFVIARFWFEWISSAYWIALAVAPDFLYLVGNLIFIIRVDYLKWPDKSERRQSGSQPPPKSA